MIICLITHMTERQGTAMYFPPWLRLVKEDPFLKDDFRFLLFGAVLDRVCSPIDDNMKIVILEGGQVRQMTMGELEFISENRENLKSQTSEVLFYIWK